MPRSIAPILLFSLLFSHSFAGTENDKSPLNDTGITWHGLLPKGVKLNCEFTDSKSTEASNTPPYIQQQDCASGRDAQAGSQLAAFSFKKLDTKGKTLNDNAKKWQCVSDLVSGLTWEVKQNSQGLHSQQDRYTWYNSNKKHNGGHIGDWNRHGDHCYGYSEGKPATYCHTEQYVSRVNKAGLCGFNDWRLPTREELSNLIDFGQVKPSIDTHYFPMTANAFYWSDSPTAGSSIQAWTISFEYGFASPMRRTDQHAIRLVRTTHKNGGLDK